jgi:LysR family transcriptional regulator, cys regulon transcriptional activator
MNLQQLRYIAEIARCGLSISEAAVSLGTSQPAISKQIAQIEEELDFPLFVRKGKRFVALTPPAEQLLPVIHMVLRHLETITDIKNEFHNRSSGELTIATTHTQARYVLPKVIEAFRRQYPGVRIALKQGSPSQVGHWIMTGEADIGIATESLTTKEGLIAIPCYSWHHCVVAPIGHPIFDSHLPTLQTLAKYPLITYDDTITGGATIQQVFSNHQITPNIALLALDADVIKTYVQMGMGIGIIAGMAYEPEKDTALRSVSLAHLFPASTTKIALSQGTFLRRYMMDFITLFSPDITPHHLRLLLNGADTHDSVDD